MIPTLLGRIPSYCPSNGEYAPAQSLSEAITCSKEARKEVWNHRQCSTQGISSVLGGTMPMRPSVRISDPVTAGSSANGAWPSIWKPSPGSCHEPAPHMRDAQGLAVLGCLR